VIAIEAHLIEKQYWTPCPSAKPRWIFVSCWNEQWRETQFYRYTRRYPDEWIEWTEANPALARLLWPKVLSILRRGITGGYAAHVMFLARQSSTVEEFRDYVANLAR